MIPDINAIDSRPWRGRRPQVVIDTDTYNEIDDQFALAYLLRSHDIATTEAIYAAPFFNEKSNSPGDGMEKSYIEIEVLLTRLNMEGVPHYKGAARTLENIDEPVESAASRDLVERALGATSLNRLVVVAIGCITNVASAILMEPEIKNRMTIVWLAGQYPYFPEQREFNLMGDLVAAQVIFDSGVPLYIVPALGVSSHLTTSRQELAAHLDLEDPLSRFLFRRFCEHGPSVGVLAKEIWDVAAVAWVLRPETVQSFPVQAPRVDSNGTYVFTKDRRPVRFAYHLDRNRIFTDLLWRLKPPSLEQ